MLFWLKQLGGSFYFVLQLIVLDLQGIDGQAVVGVVQFGQQIALVDEIAFVSMDTCDLSGGFESRD